MKHLSAIFLAAALVFSVSCATAPADFSQEAFEYYQPTAEQSALAQQARDLVDAGQVAKARQILEKSIRETNNRDAIATLAVINIVGMDGQQDVIKGVFQLEKAAKMGSWEASDALMQFYRQGKFVPQNPAKADFWQEKTEAIRAMQSGQ